MTDVTLTAAVRNSLLSLQNTSDLINRTQSRLSSGLKVSSAIDDPVAYFQAKGLNDRASDFTEKKEGIDQGISTLTAANDAVEGIDNLVRQLKGIAQSLKTATSAQSADLVDQYNELRGQINELAADATYQGTNLVNGTGQTLTIEFSERDTSQVAVNSVDLTAKSSGLNLSILDTQASQASLGSRGFVENRSGVASHGSIASQASLASIGSIAVTQTAAAKAGRASIASAGSVGSQGTLGSFASRTSVASQASRASARIGELTFASEASIGSVASRASVGSAASIASAGSVASSASLASLASVGSTESRASRGSAGTRASVASVASYKARAFYPSLASVASQGARGTYVKAGDTTALNAVIDELDSALTSLRTNAQTLGQNVALLNTRLDFTEQYVNTLTAGASKLTLADINEEGANLLALQTRQQLGVQALSFAGQAEQSVLRLFG
jgi:flagellin-like hook-associated protein FlgL